MKRECETCIKRKTPYCPTSIDCMATDDMPYYQNRIMLLEENQELKKQLEDNKNTYLLRLDSVVTAYKNQQKEFIDWLEDKIKFSTKPTTRVLLKSILQNYKEIIGKENDSTK